MNNIKISSFKAFKDDLEISLPNNRSLLLYGENGSGKSSLYKVFKVIFFKDKMQLKIDTAPTPEEQEQINRDFWSSYNNKITSNDFQIKINGTDYGSFNTNDFKPFLVTLENIHVENEIKLIELLDRFDLPIDNTLQYCQTYYSLIQNSVNEILSEIDQNICIEIENETDYTIKLIDNKRNITSAIDIRKYFNEAKINLVVLLIVFSYIKHAQVSGKKNILVLDDFITSLDAANRIILAKYVLDTFSDFQLFLFTHNASFFNLMFFLINDHYKKAGKWIFANLYEINNNNKLYQKDARITSKQLSDEFAEITSRDPAKIEILGNRIRQKFEILLYEFSKLVLLGALDESNVIIERIGKAKSLYCKDNKTIYDLIDEINTILTQVSTNKKIKTKILQKINEYKINDLDNIKYIVKELTLYRKITLHPMSHGSIGLTTFNIKELRHSLYLIEKLEAALKDIVNRDVNTI